LSTAAIAVPTTNPSCTAPVSQPTWDASSCHSSRSCAETALAENHDDIPNSSAQASKPSTSQRHPRSFAIGSDIPLPSTRR
jgi:hypothetical protein